MRYFIFPLALLLMACMPGQSRTNIKDMSVAQMADILIADGEELSQLLQRVDDEKSAKAIKPKLKRMLAKYKYASEQLEGMEPPNMSQMGALMSRAPKIAATQSDVFGEIQRIYSEHPEAADVLRDTIESYGF